MSGEGAKSCFPPVARPDARVLVLGSLPGDASLQAGQYYAHPRNQFWPLMQAITGRPLAELAYAERLEALQQAGVALWDVIASARRRGSLDADIRDQQANDLRELAQSLPRLRAVAFNGATAARAAGQLDGLALDILALPSSSPAHTLAFDRKLEVWRQLGRYL
ncbi:MULTISPECIES: DNA-deoxyinosine glycosylase [Chromobacterium]|uniref:DNA-deoxyinosine glycosylase n=1 Tax=Chromobacterium rhizoryzae TaxID=1778675 RepID=A0AAD0RRC3_9NEIS|nr:MULTISPECIES: DNA-deoxyinosine glycosylase [Chromobacterium]AXT46005.1 DNA-deoxyinosine glycosylase [Chromobacterium rhizoryzae]PTU70375.1 DNA-deoxyinosine glycosylase [Chromobacterium haemolyticum]QOD84349.1 DNA-deoxyinosine glycosylase [Chromobacterium haemolyticum]